jgi:predicted RND superfamily exporter protein
VEAVRRFAPFAAAGVVAGALMPFLWLWALRPFISSGACLALHHGPTGVRVGRWLGSLATACLHRRRLVLGFYALLTLAAALLMTRVRSDVDFLAALPSDNPVRQAHQRIDERLTGILPLDLLVDLGRQPRGDDLPALARATAAVRDDPTVAYACSIADVARLLAERAGDAGQAVSDDPLADLRLGAQAAWRRFVAAGFAGGAGQVVRILARQHDASVTANAEAAERLARVVAGEMPGSRVVVASAGRVLAETTSRLLPSVAWTLGLALPVIAVLLLIVLRSWRLALVALVLAGLPLLITYASLPLLGWPLDIGVAMIACIALGIIMDDSIHLTFAVARSRGVAGDAAVEVGPVLLGATLAMSASFLACLFGGFAYTRHFGALLATVFLIGLAINLTLAPALVACLRRRP